MSKQARRISTTHVACGNYLTAEYFFCWPCSAIFPAHGWRHERHYSPRSAYKQVWREWEDVDEWYVKPEGLAGYEYYHCSFRFCDFVFV